MNYILSASFYLILFYALGILFPSRHKARPTIEDIFIQSTYSLTILITVLFLINFFFPLKYLLNPFFYSFIFLSSVILTIKLKPKITLYGLMGIFFYYLTILFIFQVDVIFKTKVSFGWNEDFFFHERIIRIVNNYSQFYQGLYPQGYINTVGKTLNFIHYPIGSHILSNLFNNFDSIFHPVIAATSNAKIFYSYSLLVFLFLIKRKKIVGWLIIFIGVGIYLFPLMQSMVANDFIAQFSSFFLITILIWKFLQKEFDLIFLFIIFALFITYYFMVISFIPAFVILGTFLLSRKRFSYLTILAGITLFMFYYYLPLAKHVENDIVPGGLINKFSWLEVSGIKLIYSGITANNRLRYFFIPLLILSLITISLTRIYEDYRKKNLIKKIKENLYIFTFFPVIITTIISYYFLKPYLFYKLLPSIYIMTGFLIVLEFKKLSKILKILFVFSWVSVIILNIYHTRLYYYNPIRTTNSQFPNTEQFKTVDKLISGKSVIISDNIYFNNLLSLKHNDINIYTNSAYSDFIPELLVNYVDKDSEYYLPDYPINKLDNIFIPKDLDMSTTPPLSSFLFNRIIKDNLVIYSTKKIIFRPILEDNKPLLVKNFNDIKNIFPLTNKKRTIIVWQNKNIVADSLVNNGEVEHYLEYKYPLFIYSAYELDKEDTLKEKQILENNYLKSMREVLDGDSNATGYMVDVGLYTDSFFINNFQKIRYWEPQRGWSKLINSGANVVIPLITRQPKEIIFSIGSLTKQKIKIISNNCQTKILTIDINETAFKDVILDIPENCQKNNYIFKIDGPDLGRDSLILDRFTVNFLSSQ